MRVLFIVLLMPVYLFGQISLGFEAGLNYIPVKVSQYLVELGNPYIQIPANYLVGIQSNYLVNKNQFLLGVSVGSSRMRVNNLTVLNKDFEVMGVAKESLLKDHFIQVELNYSRMILANQKTSIWSGLSFNLNLNPFKKTDASSCGYIIYGKGVDETNGKKLEYNGQVNLQNSFAITSHLERHISKSNWICQFGINALYYYPYTSGGSLESKNPTFDKGAPGCKLVRIETYNKLGFQLNAGLFYSLGKKK